MEGRMTRRCFLCLIPAAALGRSASPPPLIVPIHVLLDTEVKLAPSLIQRFWSRLWPETVRDFGRCGIRFETVVKSGEVWRAPERQPVIRGLERGVINLVLTDQIPVFWDYGR